MERKTKHRILGVFAILALIVILLPLFQNGNELPTETKLVKAPPFPDQSVQVPTPLQASADHPVIPVQTPQVENEMAEQNDIISTTRPTVVNDLTPAQEENPSSKATELEPALAPEDDDFKTQTISATQKSDNGTPTVKTAEVKKSRLVSAEKNKLAAKLAKADKKLSAMAIKAPLTDNGLVELKNAVWVIQIGSFKNKANALRLVNQLRANGYRAFIQHISNTFGDNTRVFVGPEYKHHSARALASRLESDMHIRGIVISYKPLTL